MIRKMEEFKLSTTLRDKRDNAIDEALRYHGLSVIIRDEKEFNHIKNFLSEDILYLDFVPQMYTRPTGIIIWSDYKDFSPGQVGCAKYQESKFIRTVEFKDFFKI